MIKLSELQMKEVVLMSNGKKLGFIDDLEIDEIKGFITAIILTDNNTRASFFSKPTELIVYWEQIVTIGADIILIKEMQPIITIENQEKSE